MIKLLNKTHWNITKQRIIKLQMFLYVRNEKIHISLMEIIKNTLGNSKWPHR